MEILTLQRGKKMKMIKKTALVLMLCGGMLISGCDVFNKAEDKSKTNLLLAVLVTNASNTQNRLSINSNGVYTLMNSISGFGYSGGGYVGAFQKDTNNWVQVGWSGPQPMTPATFTEASSGFLFSWVKSGIQYTTVSGKSFTFKIERVSGGQATGIFNGTLQDASNNSLYLSGNFDEVTIR